MMLSERRIALATLFPAARPYFRFVDLRAVLRVGMTASSQRAVTSRGSGLTLRYQGRCRPAPPGMVNSRAEFSVS